MSEHIERRHKTTANPDNWQGADLRNVIARFASHGDRPAIVSFPDGKPTDLSYGALAERISQRTSDLTNAWKGSRQRAAIIGSNRTDWIVDCLAVINAGGVAVPIDPRFDDQTLRYVLADSKPAMALVREEECERFEKVAPPECSVVALGSQHTGVPRTPANPVDGTTGRPDKAAVIFYTSGTTGPPKGVPLSHGNLMFEVERLSEFGLMSTGERLLLPLPLHHVYPFVIGMLTALRLGVGIVLPQSMSGPHILQATREGGVATIIGVPRLYDALLSGIEDRAAREGGMLRSFHPILQRTSRLAREHMSLRLGKLLFRPLHRRIGPQLRLLASGGAALDEDLARNLEALGWTVATGYGLTETSPLLTVVPPGDTHFHTAGKPIPGVQIRIGRLEAEETEDSDASKHAAGNPVDGPPIGEIQVRGPNVFSGYLDKPDRTAEAFTADGWFRTEDRGRIDADGYLHVLGRASTFIVTPAGENISLEDLERRYARHPRIEEIGIFMRDERLAAVVVPTRRVQQGDDGKTPEEAAESAVNERGRQLPSYERVDDVVVSRNALSRTRLGKLRRHELRERFDKLRSKAPERDAPSGPMPVSEMSGEDQALIESHNARQVWELLAEKYPDIEITPDSTMAGDLEIDSLEWINVTLDIGQATDIELSEDATARVETVRDLLREVVEHADRTSEMPADLAKNPEQFLSEEQLRWLKPLNAAERTASRLLYHLNRLIMRVFFRLGVTGVEHIRTEEPKIIAPNHASLLDPFLMAAALPYEVMQKTSFTGWTGIAFANPLYRVVARLARTLPVEHDRAAFSSLALPIAALNRGMDVVWFPEGARSANGKLQELKPGIGILLAKHPVPVIPVHIGGSFASLPPGNWLPRPTQIVVRFVAGKRPDELSETGEGESKEERITDALHQELLTLQAETDK